MTSEQITRVCNACIDRCTSGNTWPPDFAEFVSLVAECGGGVLGLTVDDVLAENKRWRDNFFRYNCTEAFPWKHPVLYQICIVLKRKGIEYKLTEKELRNLAGKELEYWEKRAKSGVPIPPIRRQLAAPKVPVGPTPAQQMANGVRYVK
ncbi:replication protein [Serratia sp. S1B]|nr:replication protein [Serratia sp. S1B]